MRTLIFLGIGIVTLVLGVCLLAHVHGKEMLRREYDDQEDG